MEITNKSTDSVTLFHTFTLIPFRFRSMFIAHLSALQTTPKLFETSNKRPLKHWVIFWELLVQLEVKLVNTPLNLTNFSTRNARCE